MMIYFPAGGGSDLIACRFAHKLTGALDEFTAGTGSADINTADYPALRHYLH